MPKPKLALALPLIQFFTAATLLHYAGTPDFQLSTPRFICWALNTPALIFRGFALQGPIAEWRGRTNPDIDLSDFFFLAGVIVTWYCVGRALDEWMTQKPRMGLMVAVHCFLMAMGGLVLAAGFHCINLDCMAMRVNCMEPATCANTGILPFLFVWPAALVPISARGLLRAIRPSHPQ